MLKRNLPSFLYRSDVIIFPEKSCVYETSELFMVNNIQFIKMRWVGFGNPKNKEAHLPVDLFLKVCEYVKLLRESDE